MKGMIIEPHMEGCRALVAVEEGQWQQGHPWAGAHYQALGRERTGKPHTGCRIDFLVYRCNDPQCSAELIFLAETLERDLGLRPKMEGVKEAELDDLWHDSQRKMTWEYEDD